MKQQNPLYEQKDKVFNELQNLIKILYVFDLSHQHTFGVKKYEVNPIKNTIDKLTAFSLHRNNN